MTTDDRSQFALAMTRLFAIYGDELTDALLDAWFGVLAGYDLREVRVAMSAHVTDPNKGRFRPTPADIIRHITETLPGRRREAHFQRVRALRERIEPLDERFRQLKSALDLGIMPDEDKRKAYAEMNGIAMQTAALNRELSLLVDDRPKLTMGREPALLAASLPEIEHGRE